MPSGITIDDCVRVYDRSGHLITWSDSSDNVLILGKRSVWGASLENISMRCNLKNHKGCRCAKSIHQAY